MNIRPFLHRLIALTLTVPLTLSAAALPKSDPASETQEVDAMWANFSNPPDEYKSRPLWFWNDSLQNTTKAKIREIMVNSKQRSGYFGFGILPNWIDNYMSEEYLELYRYALETAKELGMKMCLYDENGFPSGSAGGLLAKNYPQDTLKRLDKTEVTLKGGEQASLRIPSGEYATYLGAVAMNLDTLEIRDVSDKLTDGVRVEYTAPAGEASWKVMAFATVKSDDDNLRGGERVDYLDKTAVDHLIDITHNAYYKAFPEYFGTVIDSAFYDEPMLYKAQGRTWTGKFNQLFEEKYGYNPITLYPALWYNIGEDTASARNTLMGFRTELFAENYIKNMNDWCNAHNIRLTGHMDQEENVSPVSSNGDLMKVFRYQDIPGVDEILSYDRARKAYKIVSSSAYNWDKGLVMTETYGAMGEAVGMRTLYKDVINQFAKGINYIVPHAIWLNNTANVENPPELSYRSTRYGKELPAYNDFISRTSSLLQDGRHVADIGVYYPIQTLMGGFTFDAGDPYTGGVTPAEADYMEVGDLLSSTIRYDYTYLHPEVIAENCTVDGDQLKLNNTRNFENYKVLVLPGSKTISWAALQKIKAFYDNGGKVIATTQLPYQSSEKGHNADVVKTVCEMFGITEGELVPAAGKATFDASSVFRDDPTYGADKAFDNSDTSRWNAGDLSGGDEWLSVSFASPVTVNQVRIKEFGDGATVPYRVTKFRIQYNDGGRWVDCFTGDSIGADKVCTFAPVTTDRLRLYVDEIRSDSVSICEMSVYDEDGVNLFAPARQTAVSTNDKGGRAAYLGADYRTTLKTALDEALDVYDVEIDQPESLTGGDLTYIHKVKNDVDIYYFANSSNRKATPTVSMRKVFTNPMAWDPHTGDRTPLAFTVENGVTTLQLDIPSAQSRFVIDGEPYEAVSGVTLEQKTLTFDKIGQSAALTATVLSPYATNRTLVWTTSDAAVATVENGTVQATGEGTAVIRAASAENPSLYDECTVQVQIPKPEPQPPAKVAVSGIRLSRTAATLTEGKTLTLTASVTPTNATDRTVRWASADTAVATVSGGKVKAIGAGKTTITATAGGKSAALTLTVKPAKLKAFRATVRKKTVTFTIRKANAKGKTQIYRKAPKSKRFKLYKTTSKAKLRVKLKKKGLYRFRARAYKKVGKQKLTGAFSKTIRVKIK